MAIDLFTATYIPTIFLRNAELQAVDELPESVKNSLTPIFCLKPWKTSKHLENSITKIEKVFGEERHYFLDIDPFYQVSEIKRPAQEEFLELVDTENGAENWVEFFNDHPMANPCILVDHANVDNVREQAQAFTQMERTFLVRLTHGGTVGRNWSNIVAAMCETDHTNFGFVIDVEWGRDILSRYAWADGIVKQIVEARGDTIPIILSGSSFPNSFVTFGHGDSANVDERVLFNNLIANNNEARLVYGDWASSRSPSEAGGGGHPIPPRIDLATESSWEVYRFRDDEGGFPAAASAAMESASYPHGLKIWATYVIEATALDDPSGVERRPDNNAIRSLTRATAIRINLHLYRQQNFGAFDSAPDTDDEYRE